jgi:hypothetical protein
LKAVLKMRMISELSLLTIVCVFLSQRTGTVNLARGRECSVVRVGGSGTGAPAAVGGVRFEIEILDVLGVVQRVGVRAGEGIDGGKRPSGFAHAGRYGGDG